MCFKLRLILLLAFSFLLNSGFSQDFEYRKIENTYGKFVTKPNIEFVSIENYLPENYVKDGTVDYMEEVQKAIDENKNVIFPNFPILIGGRGIQLKSNRTIYFDKGSKLILKPNAYENYGILTLKKITNVSIYNATLVGDREEHKGKSGEWGMGIRLHNSQNIKIYNVDIYDTWGDGIYITSYPKSLPTKNIEIKYGSIDNVRRNGISIISGQNITIDSLQISNVNGHNPASGIDVEPNENTENKIENLVIKNILTYNNEKDGLLLVLKNLIESHRHNRVSISILNHIDRFSRYGFRLTHAKNSGQSLVGDIIVENLNYLDSKEKIPVILPEDKFARRLPNVKLKGIRTNNVGQKRFQKLLRKQVEGKKKIEYIP